MKKDKITIRVLIENDRVFVEEYNTNQKIHVIVNKALANLKITADGRELRREDGTPITNFELTIEDVGIFDNETLRFMKKAPKPDRDKGFAVSADWRSLEQFKNLVDSELGALKNGLGGEFQLIEILPENVTGGRLACVGELKVSDNISEIVMIVFPVHYPYAEPRVTVGAYDRNTGFNSFVIKHFNKGNQYHDGHLCLMERNTWNPQTHSVGWLLRRTQSWLRGAHRPEGFLASEIVEEFPALMQHVGQVIIPKTIMTPPGAMTGVVHLTQFKRNHYIVEQNMVQTSPFTINVGVEPFRWYRVDNVKLNDIIKQPADLLTVIDRNFGEILLDGSNKNIALYLPGDEQEWHFFKLINGQIAYYISRNVEKDLFVRAAGIFDITKLLAKRVTIIGVGALGSEVAVALARNGVGIFDLFDVDTFEIGNLIRHAADIFFIGERKTQVGRQLILRTNPGATVNTFDIDVLDDVGVLENCLSQSDLCIVLTAEDSVDYMINDRLVSKYDIPFIFARVAKGAFSGSVQVVRAGHSPCLRCLSAKGKDTLPQPSENIELNAIRPEYGGCSNPAVPGSGIDSIEVAMQVSRVALQLLSDDAATYPKLAGSQFYWHGPFGSTGNAPFSWQIESYQSETNCLVCGKKHSN